MYKIFKNGEVAYEVDHRSLAIATFDTFVKKFGEKFLELFEDSVPLLKWRGGVPGCDGHRFVIC